MKSSLDPVEIAALVSLPLRGAASLAELVVDASLSPAELQRGLHLLHRRNLVVGSDETSQRYRLTALGRSARRSLDSSGPHTPSGPAIMLDKQEKEELRAAKNDIDDELDRELGPVDSEFDQP